MSYEKEIKVLDHGYVRYIDHMGSDQRILEAARVSYKSKGKGEVEDKKLLNYLWRNKHCYHPNMEVLTSEGWKKWGECSQYENYAIPDPITKTINFEKLELLSFDVENEKMEGFKNRRMSYLVTGNHKMWYRAKRDFRRKDKNFKEFLAHMLPQWGHFECGVNYSITNIEEMNPMFQLIGFYLGDGFLSSSNIVAFRLVKQRKLKYLEDVLRKSNILFSKKERGKTVVGNMIYEYHINRDDVRFIENYVDLHSKSKEKSFDETKIIELTACEQRSLLDGLINSDGSIKKDREQIEFGSTSERLTKLVETLSSFFEFEAHRVKGFGDFKTKLYNKKGRTSLEARKDYFFTEIYTGKVYCTTSSTGFLIVRGKEDEFSFVCGNSSPFEMVKLTLNIKLPIFLMRQYVRHRMQNLNEVSARYTELPNEFYIPEKWRKQDTKNKQGSIEDSEWIPQIESMGCIYDGHEDVSSLFLESCQESYKVYQSMLNSGIAREMARMILPVNIYTEIYACWDLKNLLHFITLRDDSHAQAEIQEYGKAIKEICTDLFPWTMEAYNNK